MLEHWYRERRSLVDFRRGPLGPHFDGFAAHLRKSGYSYACGKNILGKSCLFNTFLIDRGITNCKEITPSLIDGFLDVYLSNFRSTCLSYCPRSATRRMLLRLFDYLVEARVLKPIPSKQEPTPYDWILDPYMKYLREECQLTEPTVLRARKYVHAFLAGLGAKATRKELKSLRPDAIERCVKQHVKGSPENLSRLVSCLRRFLRFCAQQGHIQTDLSGVIPSVPSYRWASLPKGMEDSQLERVLNAIPKDTAMGSRDYALMILMMAFGVRGKSVAELLLEDLCWPRSTIRIRAQKGGKEVVLPLMEAVGEAILGYLRHRPETSFREVFLTVKAPFRPLNSVAISRIVRHHMQRAGVKMPGSGSTTLRHSWAIRALAHDSPMKQIADVLGHRCLDTTFIYAKADLKTLRQVAMRWPEGR